MVDPSIEARRAGDPARSFRLQRPAMEVDISSINAVRSAKKATLDVNRRNRQVRYCR